MKMTYEEYKKLNPEEIADGTCITDMPKSVHGWFELTYANYAVLPRSILQSMPEEWQHQFVECMEQLDKAFDWQPEEGRIYRVSLHEINECKDEQFGNQIPDPLLSYRSPNFTEIARRKNAPT